MPTRRTVLGPSVSIACDAVKTFPRAVFQANANMLHIVKKYIPLESAGSMIVVERHHSPTLRAFNIIRKDAPNLEKEGALQMAVRAINDSIGPDELVPALLELCVLPPISLSSRAFASSILKRAAALREARKAISKQLLSKQVCDALTTRKGSDVSEAHRTPVGSHALIYRQERGKWERLYSLFDMRGEDITTRTPIEHKKFSVQ